jgi:hypothetical protein
MSSRTARLQQQMGGFALFLQVAVGLESLSSNVVLTMIGVWLATLNRADSPRFDMLAGDASLAFGPASHVTNKALAQALNAAPDARPWDRAAICSRRTWTLALRGYCL